MRRTTFCLLIPGNTVSSRRITDIVLSGCIPVFLGPPHHNTPLRQWVDFAAFSIFIHVQDFDAKFGGAGAKVLKEVPKDRSARDGFDVKLWIPTIPDLDSKAVKLPLSGIDEYLRASSSLPTLFVVEPCKDWTTAPESLATGGCRRASYQCHQGCTEATICFLPLQGILPESIAAKQAAVQTAASVFAYEGKIWGREFKLGNVVIDALCRHTRSSARVQSMLSIDL